MPDSSHIKDTAEAVKGIAEAIPVYQDLLQPAVRELGGALATVAKTVKIALAPVSAMVWGYDQIAEFVTRRVSEHLAGIPPERIVTPSPNVAGPTLEALRFTASVPELREMYARLLASAMHTLSRSQAHPAYVEIIRQLTPDEAKILRHLGAEPGLAPAVACLALDDGDNMQLMIYRHSSRIANEAKCEFPGLCESYIDNLVRLGLVEVRDGPVHGFDYRPLSEYVQASRRSRAFHKLYPNGEIRVRPQAILPTDFGKQFIDSCVAEERPASFMDEREKQETEEH